jgi:hypothetical protein
MQHVNTQQFVAMVTWNYVMTIINLILTKPFLRQYLQIHTCICVVTLQYVFSYGGTEVGVQNGQVQFLHHPCHQIWSHILMSKIFIILMTSVFSKITFGSPFTVSFNSKVETYNTLPDVCVWHFINLIIFSSCVLVCKPAEGRHLWLCSLISNA